MNKEKERAFTGVWIPKHIWLNDDLSPMEKLFLAEIESLDNDKEKGCFASNEYFGNFFKISEGRAANIISGLRKRGYIKQVFFDGKVRGIRVHENVKAGFTLNGDSLHENVKAGFTKRGKQVSRKREVSNNKEYNKADSKVDNKEEKGAALPLFSSSKPENENQTLEAEKETPPPSSAQPPPLSPPFTPTGETIEPQPATVVRMYDPQLPAVTIVDSVPAKYETTRGKKENRYEPHIHPENENVFAHFTDPERTKTIWAEWLKYKWGEKRQKYKTPQSELSALRRLWEYSGGETSKAGEIIETAVANLWQGFFKPKEEKRFTNKAVKNHATLANIVAQSRRAAFGHGNGGEMGNY